MLSNDEMIRLQARKHGLVTSTDFRSEHEYVLHLMHTKAYQQAASLAEGKRVLDLGCNTGYGTEILSHKARAVIGVDVSENAIAAARRAHRGHRLTFQVIDGKGLPFDDGEFDLIVCCQVIEHVVEAAAFVSELKRKLSPRGIAFLTTPNAAVRLDPGMKPWNEFHVREHTSDDLKALLARLFGQVTIYGMFAEEPLYSIERRRVVGAKEAAIRIARVRRSLRRRVIARIADNALRPVAWVRRALANHARARAKQEALAEFIAGHGVHELGYLTRHLEDALDLLAICTDDEHALERAMSQIR